MDKIQRRVTDDVAAQKLKEEIEKEARKERIEKLKALQNGVGETNVPTEIKDIESSDDENPFQPHLENIKVHTTSYNSLPLNIFKVYTYFKC